MILRSGVVHAIAECETCGKTWTGYKNAQAVGARHSQLYGHIVHVEVGLAITYGPGQKKEAKGADHD